MGPSGAYSPDPAADWHLMVGDETALPAISVALEALPANAIGQVFIEVAEPDDEIPLAAPDGVQVNWILRGGRADLVGEERAGDHSPLVEAVKTAHWLPGQVHAFVHGEAQAVMHNLRPYIRKERGSTRSGRRSRATGAAAAPKRRSGSGRRNSPRPRPARSRACRPI